MMADTGTGTDPSTDRCDSCGHLLDRAQQAEHTALQPKQAEVRGKVQRIHGTDGQLMVMRGGETVAEDPWLDQPAGHLDVPQEDQPGTIDGRQQRAIMARLGTLDRAERLGHIIAIVGRDINSTNELSWKEAAKVLAETGDGK